MIDLDDNRLKTARKTGTTATINRADGNTLEAVMKLPDRRGVNTPIEAVGILARFELCQQIVASGGTIANIGVHGEKVYPHLESLWDRNIDTTRLVDTATVPIRFKTVSAKKIDPKRLEAFSNGAKTKALKVII